MRIITQAPRTPMRHRTDVPESLPKPTQAPTATPRRRLLSVALAVGLAGASGAWSASFDCTKAATAVEKMICADAELSRLDSELGERYDTARRAPGASSAAIQAAQRDWMQQRNECADTACIAQLYAARIEQLGGVPTTPGPDSAPDEQHAAPMGLPRTERSAETVRLRQEGDNFRIDAAYPRLAGDGAAAAEAVLAAVVDRHVNTFRDDYRDLIAGNGGDHIGPPWELAIDYDETYTATRFWAVGLSSYSYTGGAHGGGQHLPVVIDRSTAEQIPPAGLFLPDADWLTVVSDYSYEALASRKVFKDDDGWLREGTAPELENYRKLLPLADGLHVFFEQYQVGPYVIGSHEVTVPYDRLSGLLAPALFPDGKPD
jgi:uncharacterized protein